MSGFYVDPACPFAWLASKWARMVQAQRDYTAGWRFISLWMINPAVGCDSHFPPGYEASHAAGLKLLRVAARTRAQHGRAAVRGRRRLHVRHRQRFGPWRCGYRGIRTFLAP